MGKAELFKIEFIQILDLADVVGSQGEYLQALVRTESFNSVDFILIKVELLEEWVQLTVLDLRNLVACEVSILKVCWRIEVKKRCDLVVTSIQFDEMLYC